MDFDGHYANDIPIDHCPFVLCLSSSSAPPECEPNQFSCNRYQFNETYCIPPHYKCDMTQDCIDGSDESDCSEYPPPPLAIKWCPLSLLLSSSEDNNNNEEVLIFK